MEISTRQLSLALLCSSAATLVAQAADTPPSSPTTELSKITVQEAADSDYVAPNATTGTKTDTPLMETPVAIQVIPQQVLQDQKTISLDQALQNVSGVTTVGTDDIQEGVNIRGFYTSQTLRDGVMSSEYSTTGGGTVGAVNMTDVESVEVLKGPAAILYGRMEPGGIVNVVRKQPLDQFSGSAELLGGSWDHYRASIDLTGPANEGKTLLYRVNTSYDQSDFWRNNVFNKTWFLAPTLEWRPSSRTTVKLEGEYGHDNRKFDMQLVPIDQATNKLDLSFPRNENFMDNRSISNTSMTALTFEHQFNAVWSMKYKLVHDQTIEPAVSDYYPYGCDPTYTTCGMFKMNGVWMDYRTLYYGGGTRKADSTVLDITGKFEALGMKHTLLFGGDYSRARFSFIQGFGPPGSDQLINAENPAPPNIPVDPTTISSFDYSGGEKNFGFYLQDQLALPGNVMVLAGLREQHFVSEGTAGSPTLSDHHLTPRLGIVWRAEKWLSLYTSYTEGFGNNNGFDWQHNPLPPEGAKQEEVGAKGEFLDGKLSSTLSLFNLDKTNVLIADVAHPDPSCAGCFFSKVGGDINSRGIEYDIQGELRRGWSLIASYTYDRALVTKGSPDGNGLIVGNFQANAPEHMLNMWSTYRLNIQDLSGLKIGGGFTWHGSSVDQSNAYTNPAFIVWNAMASYDFEVGTSKLTAQLNIRNLFDRNYYDNINYASGSFTYLTYGNPRSFTASLRVEF